MALGLSRWLSIALGAAALIAIAVLPPEPYGREPSTWYYRHERHSRRLSTLIRQTRTELRTLEVRDSLLRLADATGPGARVVIMGDAAPERKAEARRLLERWLAVPESGRGGITPLVGLQVDNTPYRDAPRDWAFGSVFTYFLPGTAGGGRCLSVGDLRLVPAVYSSDPSEVHVGRVLGPCAFFARFGLPGSSIAEWLEKVGYLPAANAVWTAEGPPGPRPVAENLDRRIWPHLFACAAGDADACRIGLSRRAPWTALRDFGHPDPRDRNIVRRWSYERSSLGPEFDLYLSDLLIEMGEARFGRFWTSAAPLESAFRDAFGLEMTEYTMRWARRQVGRPRSGPLPRTASTLSFLVLAGALLLGRVVWTGRRQAR